MAKPEWGVKRICTNCHARFYDLQKNPIECPSCGTTFDPEAFAKPKRSRPTAAAAAPAKPVAAPKPAAKAEAAAPEEAAAEGVEDEEIEEALGDDEDEDVLEDASDLGEDDDDVAEVMENIDERKEE